MTGVVDTEIGTEDFKASKVYSGKTFVQECSDFAREYPFQAFLVRLLIFLLFFRIGLDIVIEVMMIRSAVVSPHKV